MASVAIHFDTFYHPEAPRDDPGKPMRVYFIADIGQDIATVVRDLLRNESNPFAIDDDEKAAAGVFMALLAQTGTINLPRVSPTSTDSSMPTLVLDLTNGRVWAEDASGEEIALRDYTLDEFVGLSDEDARSLVEP